MRTVTYTCDLCEKKIEPNYETISVSVDSNGDITDDHTDRAGKHICGECSKFIYEVVKELKELPF